MSNFDSITKDISSLQKLLDLNNYKVIELKKNLNFADKLINEIGEHLRKFSKKDNIELKNIFDRGNILKLEIGCIIKDLNGRLEINELLSKEIIKIISYMKEKNVIIVNIYIIISAISAHLKFNQDIDYLVAEIVTMSDYIKNRRLKKSKSIYYIGKINEIRINGKNPSYYTGLKLIDIFMEGKNPLNMLRLIRNELNLDNGSDIEYLTQVLVIERLIQKNMLMWGRSFVNRTFIHYSHRQREHPIKTLDIFNSFSSIIKKRAKFYF